MEKKGVHQKNSFVFRNFKNNKDGFIVSQNELSDFKIFQGDSVYVPLMPDSRNLVNIQGHVKNPGNYPFNSKIKLKDIIDATMSSVDKDFYKTMDLSNIKILRKSISNKYPTTITTSLEENISLQNGDYINILNKIRLNLLNQ